MTDADCEAVSALIFRSYDRVPMHYNSPGLIETFREHATPKSLREQFTRKDVYVVEDGGRIVATGGVGQVGRRGRARPPRRRPLRCRRPPRSGDRPHAPRLP